MLRTAGVALYAAGGIANSERTPQLHGTSALHLVVFHCQTPRLQPTPLDNAGCTLPQSSTVSCLSDMLSQYNSPHSSCQQWVRSRGQADHPAGLPPCVGIKQQAAARPTRLHSVSPKVVWPGHVKGKCAITAKG